VDPYLLPDGLTAQRYRDFLETVLPGLLEDVPLMQRFWFQHDGAPVHYGEDVWEWLNIQVISRKVNWTWRADCMASSVAGSNSDEFFLWGHLK
jgi:hypothetical protein